MVIPEAILRQISEQTSFLELVGSYTALQKMGDRYRGLCPFHQEKSPSFYVQPEKKLFYCFGCGKGGNLFQFLMEMEHLSFPEAVKSLGEKAGISLASIDERTIEGNKKQEALRELYKRVAGSFQYILHETEAGSKGLLYLRDRGLDDSIIKKFQLGYTPSDPYWLKKFLSKQDFSSDFLSKSGLFTQRNPERSFFVNRIMFPIFSVQGEIIAFGGRILQGEGPKYLNSAESVLFKKGESLYGFYQAKEIIRKTKTVLLVEGYMDVLALHQAGVETAVAPLGTALTAGQVRLIRRFADTVVLFFDSDEAGFQAIQKASILCEQNELVVLAVDPSGYPFKDPADFIQKGKLNELQKIVKYPIPILEYLLKKISTKKGNVPQPEYQLKVVELFPYIESMVSEVKRDSALAYVADFMQLERESLKKDFLRKKGVATETQVESGEDRKKKIQRSPELVLMIIASGSRTIFEEIRSRVSLDDFDDPNGRELYICLEEMYREEEWSMDRLLGNLSDESLKTYVLSTVMTGEFSLNLDRQIHDSVLFLKRRNLEHQSEQTLREIKYLQRIGKEEDLPMLLEKKMYLDGELNKLKVVENE